jgi:hypothetical protein
VCGWETYIEELKDIHIDLVDNEPTSASDKLELLPILILFSEICPCVWKKRGLRVAKGADNFVWRTSGHGAVDDCPDQMCWCLALRHWSIQDHERRRQRRT